MIDTLTWAWYHTALILGMFTIVVWTYRTLCVIGRNFGFGTELTLERYGKDSWAVVTGATDGIGKAAAMHIAKEGFNVVLISRTLSKLETVAKEVEEHAKKNGKTIQTKVVQLDFTKNFDAPTFAKLYEQNLKDIDVSVLVNNVGMAGDPGIPLHETSDQDVHNMMSCNMYGNVLLTREVI